jgi:hypothetical protein
MFVIVKLALVTSAFYVGIAIALEALLLGLMYWKGGIILRRSSLGACEI